MVSHKAMKCTKHEHSSESSAKRCYEKQLQKRVDRRVGKYPPQPHRYRQTKNDPPRLVSLRNVDVYVFFEGEVIEP